MGQSIMSCLAVIPNDPISAYLTKGEIKRNYYNPGEMFDEVHLITLASEDVDPRQVQALVGRARLFIHPVGRPSPVDFLAYFPRVARLMRQIDPDLIRAHNPWLGGALAVHAGRRIAKPTIVYLHIENDQRRLFDPQRRFRLVRPLEHYSLTRADLVICVSHFLESYARRYGAKKVATVYNKVYLDQFYRQLPHNRHHPIHILYVGRLDPQKAPHIIIEAVAGLEARLTIIGDGTEYQKLKNLAERLEVSEKVRFIRTVPNAEIHNYYHQADIFAMATHYEGFCIPILEAMASGLAVVACDTQPLPEVLGDSGLIVSKAPGSFKAAFQSLMADQALSLALGQKAQQRAGRMDGRVMEEREVALYRRLMGATTAKPFVLFQSRIQSRPRLAVLPHDQVLKYFLKGEVKPRYFNPEDLFAEIHVITLADEDIQPDKVKAMAGRAQLFIHPLGRPRPWSLERHATNVVRLISHLRPDVIRAYNPLYMGRLGATAGGLLGVPVVISVHDDYSLRRNFRLYGFDYLRSPRGVYQLFHLLFFNRSMFRNTSQVICAYPFAAKWVDKYAPSKRVVILNRVYLDQFRPKSDYDVNGRFKILNLGRQFAGKNPENILKAVAGLDVDLTLVGNGPIHPGLMRLTRQLGLNDRVRFISALAHELIPALMIEFDLFAMHLSQPGICIPVLEAMASGLPVVMNRPRFKNGLDLVGDHVVQVADTPQGYKAAFERLMADRAARQGLGRAGTEFVRQYEGRKTERMEADLYRRLLGLPLEGEIEEVI